MHDHEVDIDVDLVRKLLTEQMPAWAKLSLSIVEPWGTDNAIWRLGDELVVRLPRIGSAERQVSWEDEWLPQIRPHLDVTVPTPMAVGEPGCGYPYKWAVHHWVTGSGAAIELIDDPTRFALDLAHTVEQIAQVPTTGLRSAVNRGQHIRDYDADTRKAIHSARHLIDVDAATQIWEAALDAKANEVPHFVHGDLEGNCVVRDGRLHGLIDWGLACAGDPAVDVQVAWSTLFTDTSRQAFLDALKVDDATIARARGAGINQACGALPYYMDTYPLIVERSWHKLEALGVPTKR